MAFFGKVKRSFEDKGKAVRTRACPVPSGGLPSLFGRSAFHPARARKSAQTKMPIIGMPTAFPEQGRWCLGRRRRPSAEERTHFIFWQRRPKQQRCRVRWETLLSAQLSVIGRTSKERRQAVSKR